MSDTLDKKLSIEDSDIEYERYAEQEPNSPPKYKFNEENGKHEHLLWSERKQQFEQLTGATTILDVLGKVLTWWAAGLAVSKLGWSNSKIKVGDKYQNVSLEQRITHLKPFREAQSKLNDKDYLSLLDEAYKAHSVRLEETADAGTDMHKLLEDYVDSCVMENGKPKEYDGEDKRVKEFSEWAIKNVKQFIWSEACCYDELLFVGGITDCGAVMKDGSIAIIDFKSAKDVYFNHMVQIGIYHLLIEKHGLFFKDGSFAMMPDGEITKYIVIPFGSKEFVAVENTNIANLKKAALASIQLYRSKAIFENK